ncbi:MAG TPA: cellulase family glycosylhydrolase [Isosphaeraceae bacterium]|nr:cellulase family glycosylhydrolase [Isosphaeraceae bacterium]
MNVLLMTLFTFLHPADRPLETIQVSGLEFERVPSHERFLPWGFNYDRDDQGHLIEDYWETDWPRVQGDFQEMKALGANVVRVHLQFGKFMKSATEPNEKALEQLGKLLTLAETTGLYLDLTGLGCYHKADVPEWYDALTEEERWSAQARFWEAVASRGSESPAVFCYDLMNEPIVPGGQRKPGDWLGPAFAGKHYVQVISLDQKDRPRPQVAKAWIKTLVTAIRKHDSRHLITVGLVDWSLNRPGLTSGFVPAEVAEDLDFVSVHLYPESGKVDEALKTLKGFQVGKSVVIEETFPLKCSFDEFERFLDLASEQNVGVIGFYWGKSPEELRDAKSISDALMSKWLELFSRRARTAGRP